MDARAWQRGWRRRAGLAAGLALALALAGCGNKAAQEQGQAQQQAPKAAAETAAKGPAIAVEGAWARPSAEGAMTSAVYLTLRNTGDQDDALVAASTDVARKAELHETKAVEPAGGMEGSMKMEGKAEGKAETHDHNGAAAAGGMAMDMGGTAMQMRPVDRLPVPAGGSVELKPGGLHVMLMDLKRKLAVGDHFQLTLRFEKSGEKTVDVEVRQP